MRQWDIAGAVCEMMRKERERVREVGEEGSGSEGSEAEIRKRTSGGGKASRLSRCSTLSCCTIALLLERFLHSSLLKGRLLLG